MLAPLLYYNVIYRASFVIVKDSMLSFQWLYLFYDSLSPQQWFKKYPSECMFLYGHKVDAPKLFCIFFSINPFLIKNLYRKPGLCTVSKGIISKDQDANYRTMYKKLVKRKTMKICSVDETGKRSKGRGCFYQLGTDLNNLVPKLQVNALWSISQFKL